MLVNWIAHNVKYKSVYTTIQIKTSQYQAKQFTTALPSTLNLTTPASRRIV